MVNAFSSTKFPTLHNWQLLEQDLSIWGKIYWLRHLIAFESSFGSFLQSIYNNRSIIFYLVILITWSIFISKSKGKSLENNVELGFLYLYKYFAIFIF